MTPGKGSHKFFGDARRNRRKKVGEQDIHKELSKKELLAQHLKRLQIHIERQPEVLKELSKRAETLKSRHKKITESMIGIPISFIYKFKTHFAKYNDAYYDFLAATKKDHVELTKLETLDFVSKNAGKVSDLQKKESLIREYEERRLWLDSKLTILESAERELIDLLVQKRILQRKDIR